MIFGFVVTGVAAIAIILVILAIIVFGVVGIGRASVRGARRLSGRD